jgi:chemotaxis signal transduction protein
MLKTPLGPSSKESQPWSVVVFRVGGRPLAVQAGEIGGVWPWDTPVSVPSQTAFVTGIVRRGDEILAVYDLASRLQQQVRGNRFLCLIVKHHEGPMAICIDETIPSLQLLDPSLINPSNRDESDVIGTCRIEDEEVSIYSLATLNHVRRVRRN